MTPSCRLLAQVLLCWSVAVLSACGGGGDASQAAGAATQPVAAAAAAPGISAPPAAAPLEEAPSAPPAPDLAARIAAASATAASDDNACADIHPFYWEVGDHGGALAADSVGNSAGTDPAAATVQADTVLPLASASKWLYAAYVLQRRGGQPTEADLQMLTQRSGYVSFQACRAGQTVDECLGWQSNGSFTPVAQGRFFYNGGHFQRHASDLGLGAMTAADLAADWRAWLGQDLDIGMLQAQPAGGATGSAASYARFLRKLLTGDLAMADWLGRSAACASPAGCAVGEALFSPGPPDQTWHYGMGHWVEDDPVLGDGSFSSAGAFGFYPWIDAARQLYGVVARSAAAGAGEASARCGRLIRHAWRTGQAQ